MTANLTTCFDRVEPLMGCGIAGVLKACVGIEGALPIVHGTVGCAAGHRIYPLFAGKEPLVATTALTEMDAIMGAEERLRQAIARGVEIHNPALVVVILTCATSVTGEIHNALATSVEARHGVPCFVIDGSGVTGDEMDAYRAFYRAFRRWESARQEAAAHTDGLDLPQGGLELAGLSAADFEARNHLAAVEELLEAGLGLRAERVLFQNFDMRAIPARRLTPLPLGALWTEAGSPGPAPVGAEGTRTWLAEVSRLTGAPVCGEIEGELAALARDVEHMRNQIAARGLRVGIECGGWMGVGLARFFAHELDCHVLLSSDRSAADWAGALRPLGELVVDMGNLELCDRLHEFGAQLVFGSSYTRTAGWAWVPLWQPVWHVVDEQGSWMGIDGTRRLLALLDRFVERSP
jgi:nitrogenase molybdenum-iron protein alpha/beta subunit